MPRLSPRPTIKRLRELASYTQLTSKELGEVGAIGANKVVEARRQLIEMIRNERPEEYIHTNLFHPKDVFRFFGYDINDFIGGYDNDSNV